MDNMAKSAGNADKEMAVIQESLEYKINRLNETITGIAQNLFERDDMKAVVDGFTDVLNIIEVLTDQIGLFGSAIASAGIVTSIKSIA
jgi:hypothetical protein